MKRQKIELRIQNTEHRTQTKKISKVVWALGSGLWALILLSYFSFPALAAASDKWGGVDESVVEKYAEEHGRNAREPFINTDQGDLLLFVFLLAGAVGGFAGGYCWRVLTEKGTLTTEHTKQT
jgi:hypothetical protein